MAIKFAAGCFRRIFSSPQSGAAKEYYAAAAAASRQAMTPYNETKPVLIENLRQAAALNNFSLVKWVPPVFSTDCSFPVYLEPPPLELKDDLVFSSFRRATFILFAGDGGLQHPLCGFRCFLNELASQRNWKIPEQFHPLMRTAANTIGLHFAFWEHLLDLGSFLFSKDEDLASYPAISSQETEKHLEMFRASYLLEFASFRNNHGANVSFYVDNRVSFSLPLLPLALKFSFDIRDLLAAADRNKKGSISIEIGLLPISEKAWEYKLICRGFGLSSPFFQDRVLSTYQRHPHLFPSEFDRTSFSPELLFLFGISPNGEKHHSGRGTGLHPWLGLALLTKIGAQMRIKMEPNGDFCQSVILPTSLSIKADEIKAIAQTRGLTIVG